MEALVSLIFYAYSTGFITVSCDEFAKNTIAASGFKNPSAWFAQIWLPLHFGLIAVTSVVTGDLMLASQLISIGFGMLLVISLWNIGRQFGGDLAGGLAAILCATHPLVVLLSATAMVDICYVSTLLFGFRFYLKFSRSSQPRPIDLFAACGTLTIACAFHYNAWIAVLIFVPFVLRATSTGLPFPRGGLLIGSLFLLGSVPCAWVAWNWLHFGHPLDFLGKHSEYSASYWLYLGYRPSVPAAVAALFSTFTLYSPLIAILAFSGDRNALQVRNWRAQAGSRVDDVGRLFNCPGFPVCDRRPSRRVRAALHPSTFDPDDFDRIRIDIPLVVRRR